MRHFVTMRLLLLVLTAKVYAAGLGMSGVALPDGVLKGIKLFKATDAKGTVSWCTGAFLGGRTAVLAGRCVKQLRTQNPGGGLSVLAESGSFVEVEDYYLHENLRAIDGVSWQVRAPMDLAVVVFGKQASEKLGLAKPDLQTLSPAPVRESSESHEEKLYFLGYGLTTEGGSPARYWQLAQGESTVVKTHNGYFIAGLPIPREAPNPETQFAQVKWDEIGAIVLNEKFNVVGIVSSIETLRLSGISGERQFAIITSLQGEKAYQLYEKAIDCPDGRLCAPHFPNSGFQQQPSVRSGRYTNWENLHCEVELSVTMDEERGVPKRIELNGVGGDCSHYQDVFAECLGNECTSKKSCQRLTVQPAGFMLRIKGQTYAFGPSESASAIPFDRDIPIVRLSEPNPCLMTDFTEPAEQICDDDGGKWMFVHRDLDYLVAENVCTKFQYKIPELKQAEKIGAQLKTLVKPFWTAEHAPEAVQSQSPYALRALYPFDERKFGRSDGREKAAAVCYCAAGSDL